MCARRVGACEQRKHGVVCLGTSAGVRCFASLLFSFAHSVTHTTHTHICISSTQEWAIASHCFSQAKDWIRHAACKATHMLLSKSGQDHEAAVLLVEAAAGAARRHKQLTTGGSDGLTPITAEDYSGWLQTAAVVYEQRLDRVPEAVALYCQVRPGEGTKGENMQGGEG